MQLSKQRGKDLPVSMLLLNKYLLVTASGTKGHRSLPITQEGIRGISRTSAQSPACHGGAPFPGRSGYSSPSAYSASTTLRPKRSGLSAGAAPGMSCVAGEVCCMPSVLIQGRLCPRDQQFGSLPKQQPAVSSCAAALPATHRWSPGRNIPIPSSGKGSEVAFETSFEKLNFYISPSLVNTAQRTSRVLPAPELLALRAGRREGGKHPGKGWTCGEAEPYPEPS